MTLTDQEKIRKFDEQQAKNKKYYLRWTAQQKVLRRKIVAAKITVTQAEVEAEMNRK